jgi:hypothetical protein
MSIYQKLFDIKKEIQASPKLKAEGHNNFLNFSYLTPSQILGIVNPVVEKHGVLFNFSVTDIRGRKITTKITKTDTVTETEGYDYVAQVSVKIHNIEAGDFQREDIYIPLDRFTAQGYGSVLTYAERYYYTKIFGLAQDSDDPDKETTVKKNIKGKI